MILFNSIFLVGNYIYDPDLVQHPWVHVGEDGNHITKQCF